jgi:uncharacterized oxidoreductase
MKKSGNTILITGGTSGIGKELAQRFHALGNKVIIAARRQQLIDEITAGKDGMSGYVLDVEDAGQIRTFAQKVLAEHPDLNVLFNNAGIMRFEEIEHSRDLADAEATVTTNLLAPIRLIDAFIDHLTSRADSAIVNVSSGLAFVPLVATPTYSATKAAIHSYTVALREALKGKVEVIELVPPAVQTELTPGQSTRSAYMPLGEFIDEVMSLFAQDPTPPEILVQRVGLQRFAERENRFNETVEKINAFAKQAREAAGQN